MKTGNLVDLDKEIVRLEKELSNVYRKRMSLLETELQSSKARAESLGGGSAPVAARSAAGQPVVAKEGKKGKVAKAKRGRKRTRMSSELVEKKLIDTVKAAGAAGISCKGISDASGLNYQTTAKKLKEMTDTFIKKGALKEARYFVKS